MAARDGSEFVASCLPRLRSPTSEQPLARRHLNEPVAGTHEQIAAREREGPRTDQQAGFFVGERVFGLVGGVVGVLIAVALILCVAVSYHRFASAIRTRVRQDIANAAVEVLTIIDVVAFAIPEAVARLAARPPDRQ